MEGRKIKNRKTFQPKKLAITGTNLYRLFDETDTDSNIPLPLISPNLYQLSPNFAKSGILWGEGGRLKSPLTTNNNGIPLEVLDVSFEDFGRPTPRRLLSASKKKFFF